MEAAGSLKLWYLCIQPTCDTTRKSVFLTFTIIATSNTRRKEVRFIAETMENLFYLDYYFDLEGANKRQW